MASGGYAMVAHNSSCFFGVIMFYCWRFPLLAMPIQTPKCIPKYVNSGRLNSGCVNSGCVYYHSHSGCILPRYNGTLQHFWWSKLLDPTKGDVMGYTQHSPRPKWIAGYISWGSSGISFWTGMIRTTKCCTKNVRSVVAAPSVHMGILVRTDEMSQGFKGDEWTDQIPRVSRETSHVWLVWSPCLLVKHG